MPLPPIITNNLGKIAATAATATFGAATYINRERIAAWISGDDDESSSDPILAKKLKIQKRKRRQAEAEAAAATQELKRLKGNPLGADLNGLHAELLETIAQANKDMLDEVREQITGLRTALQGQLDTQRAETRALGDELRQAVADLALRQNVVEQFLHGKLPGEVFAMPGRQRPPETRRREPSNKPGPNGKRKTNGSTATAPRTD